MIVYYKSCPTCYKLIPSIPMVVRDTDKFQTYKNSFEEIQLAPGDILALYCKGCIPK